MRGLGRSQGHWLDFPKLIQAKIPDTTCYFIDLPGIDRTQAAPRQTISSYTDTVRDRFLSIQNKCTHWNILGISLGGMLTLDWILRYQDDFKNAIIINTSSENTKIKRVYLKTLTQLALAKVFSSNKFENEFRILKAITHLNPTDAHEAARKLALISEICPISFWVVIKQIYAASKFKIVPHLSLNSEIKTLFLGSLLDPLTPVNHTIKLAEIFGGRLEVHPNAGHDLPLEDPAWVVSKILDFLEI